MASMEEQLARQVADAISLGCFKANIGRARCPAGYAIMVDPDGVYTFWLDWNGRQSVSHWSKWAVLRGAKQDAERQSK